MEKETVIWSEVGTKAGIDYSLAQKFIYNDGGRKDTGFKGSTGDCVTRAIAIATGKPYKEVYDALNSLSENERIGKRKKSKSNSRTGIYRMTYQKYIESLGWKWIPTMKIGQGCKIHLRSDELPSGTLIVKVSKHLTCVKDGIIHDTFDPSRGGSRCVYGYYVKKTL
ncbi:MAG: hypothetical protein U9Q27_01945 [Patescibacteria group bacterium]|nr:hypothetical protein [Patescibacteria group bacterium]